MKHTNTRYALYVFQIGHFFLLPTRNKKGFLLFVCFGSSLQSSGGDSGGKTNKLYGDLTESMFQEFFTLMLAHTQPLAVYQNHLNVPTS